MKTLILSMLLAGSLNTPPKEHDTLKDICASTEIECQIDTFGAVIGRPGSTAAYGSSVADAARLFSENFGRTAPFTLVILGDALTPEQRELLSNQYAAILPWMTRADRRQFIEQAVRKNVEKALKAKFKDMPSPQFNALLEKTVAANVAANMKEGSSAAARAKAEALHQGAFSHELGHIFFINSYWPKHAPKIASSDVSKLNEYGGPAPDWLDEIAAVMLENKHLTQQRRASLATTITTQGLNAMWPLGEYFSIQHPSFEQAKEMIKARQKTAAGRAKGGVVVMTQAELKKRTDGRDAHTFYTQSRAFLEFLESASDKQHVVAHMARHIADGGSIDSWLRNFGPTFGLTDNSDDLDQKFKDYVSRFYGSDSDLFTQATAKDSAL